MTHLKLIVLLVLTITLSCNKKITETQTINTSEVAPKTMKEAVQSTDNAHNSQNALDWEGVYQGTLPCADCEGIKTVITLLKDNSYKRATTYLGKSDKDIHESGTFSWDASGGIITLKGDDGDKCAYNTGVGCPPICN